MAHLYEVGASEWISCGKTMGIPVDGIGNMGGPSVSETHPLEQRASVCCITDRSLELTVDSAACDIKSDGQRRREWDDGAVGPVARLVLAGLVIGIHV